jgi:hypothetical protein
VGREGWVVLTKDGEIRRRPNERDALLSSGTRAFVLTAGQLTGPMMAELLVEQMPRVERHLRKNRGPYICAITRTGIRELEHHGRVAAGPRRASR